MAVSTISALRSLLPFSRGTIAGPWIKTLSCRTKTTLDKSRVPVLNEDELEEQFVKGSGPGGQSVNKTVNCVVLCHVPTHTVVRCHESRLLHQNRQRARQMLIEKLDDLWNGEMSLRRQKEALVKKRKAKLDAKNRKQREQRKLEKAELEAAKRSPTSDDDECANPGREQDDYDEYGPNPWERKGDSRL